MYTVIMKRGSLADAKWEDPTRERALRRIDALTDLHGIYGAKYDEKVKFDEATNTWTYDATDWYRE